MKFFFNQQSRSIGSRKLAPVNSISQIQAQSLAVEWLIVLFFFLPFSAHALDMQAKISWEYQNLPGEIKIYEPKTGVSLSLWQTDTKKTFSELPIDKEIEGGNVFVPSGKSKKFILVYKNETTETIKFFASPHHVLPAEMSLGFKFQCLCINHVFSVGPGEYWYRVVDLAVDNQYRGGPVEIRHILVRFDPKAH